MIVPTDGTADFAGETAVVAGWGATSEGGSNSAQLRKVAVSVISNSQCATIYGGVVTSNMVCAGRNEGGKDACLGDSGGPLITSTGSSVTLVGVVSWGFGEYNYYYYYHVERDLAWTTKEKSDVAISYALG